MENFAEIQRQGLAACSSRLWTHTVAVVNSIRVVHPELRMDEEQGGTGCAGRWGKHYFILTASHVILPDAKPSDLRIFWRPDGSFNTIADRDLTLPDIVEAVSIRDPAAVIHRCDWEDLAIVSMEPQEAGRHTEFVDIASEWVDPAEGESVHCCGFPIDKHVFVGKRMVGAKEERDIALRPTVFSGKVLLHPNFLTRDFDPDRHYLVPYERETDSEHPKGYSGAAAWWQSKQQQGIWKPDFKFAGVCTSCYKDGLIEQIVKASAARRFLEEIFGPA
jgi:hypothetical protein